MSMNSFPEIFGITTSLVTLISYLLIKQKSRMVTVISLITISINLSLSTLETYVENKNSEQLEEEFKLTLENKPMPLEPYTILRGDSALLPESGKQFLNRYTIINFWAPWCPPCLKEMPIMESFYKEFEDDGVLILGITGLYRKTDREEKDKYMSWVNFTLKKQLISYPILYDDEAGNATKFKVTSLPLTVLLDDQSRIIEYRIGIKGAKLILDKVKKELSVKNKVK